MQKSFKSALAPLVLRLGRLIDALSKSNDEKDFYIDKVEGFIVYADPDKSKRELNALEKELDASDGRYCLFPKLTSYEVKKVMEGFVQEKIYDIDTKERLLELIQSKNAKDNFLEFIFDRYVELDKWLQFYQERMRIYIIEWLRSHDFTFVFEEDLDVAKDLIEKFKESIFQRRVAKKIMSVRQMLATKSKSYYSNEALNPRPKRGRPPKQIIKVEVRQEPSVDFYSQVPDAMKSFIFSPQEDSLFATTFSEYGKDFDEKFANSKIAPQMGSEIYRFGSLADRLAMLGKTRELLEKQLNKDDETQGEKETAAEKPKKSKVVKKEAAKPKKAAKPKLKKIVGTKKTAKKAKTTKTKPPARKIASTKKAKPTKKAPPKPKKPAKKISPKKEVKQPKSRAGKIRLKRVAKKVKK